MFESDISHIRMQNFTPAFARKIKKASKVGLAFIKFYD